MNREQRIYQGTYLLASCILGLLFLSGYQKLLYPDEFALAVYRFHLLPDNFVPTVAVYLPWLEMVCGICLLGVPRWRRAALWISLFLLIGFTGGILVNLVRGTSFSCGCFGDSPLSKPMNGWNVVRNGLLILLAVIALLAQTRARLKRVTTEKAHPHQ